MFPSFWGAFPLFHWFLNLRFVLGIRSGEFLKYSQYVVNHQDRMLHKHHMLLIMPRRRIRYTLRGTGMKYALSAE
jgi:hypothetical protein